MLILSKEIGGSTGSGRPKVISGNAGNDRSKVISGSAGNNRSKVISGGTGNSSGSSSSGNSGSSNNSDCFVATAAYGTPLQYEIQVLRNWRDNTLRYNSIGRQFIAFYYKVGPSLADFIKKYPIFKAPVRTIVKSIIRFMK